MSEQVAKFLERAADYDPIAPWRPVIVDLCCGAGGASEGYRRAGFNVFGVDIKPQPRYPFPLYVGDALKVARLVGADAVHVSPPCQGYSDMQHAPGAVGAPRLIGEFRKQLMESGLLYVIENVVGARKAMIDPYMLCGTMFGLGAQSHDLHRHRLFETNWCLDVPECAHSDRPVIGVYGGHARRRSAKHGGRGTRDAWEGGHKAAASEAMGIDWMTLSEMSEAIPPAYTHFIGQQLLRALAARKQASEILAAQKLSAEAGVKLVQVRAA